MIGPIGRLHYHYHYHDESRAGRRAQRCRSAFARLRRLALTACLSGCAVAVPGQAALLWYWEEPFTTAEQARLRSWLERTHAALEAWAGPLPFDVHLHIARRSGAGEPVPWANTRRGDRQGINFYVDAGYALEDFLADWTAPHEFAHLLLPFLGRGSAWFAEGFASYAQYAIMVPLGVIDERESQRRRGERMRRARDSLVSEREPLPQNVPALRRRGAYPTFYWGGAIYFARVDARLRDAGSSLRSVLREYLRCCRARAAPRESLDALVVDLDALSGGSVFSDELDTMRSSPGSPTLPARG